MNDRSPALEIIGHGGAGQFYPGNSRMAIETALHIGVDRIEIDVQRAADGRLVLVHDERLRNSDGTWTAARALPVEALRERLDGLLAFDEAVDLIGGRSPLLIDVKAPGYERAVADAIARHALTGSVAVSSTYANVLWTIKRAHPDVRLGISTGHLATGLANKYARRVLAKGLGVVTPPVLALAVSAVGATDVMLQFRICTPAMVARMQRLGIRVNVWTVDHPRQIRRMLDLGVDGIISNRPDLVRELAGRD